MYICLSIQLIISYTCCDETAYFEIYICICLKIYIDVYIHTCVYIYTYKTTCTYQ